ncbi:ankyrin repeat-containing domain protein [Aspergillus pseudoustus]|uniref:Ankyrin repeat-containing domain protein n=1 Tax=Aspergillus pseudoustus TaxID=1810923 RepID=A0ABR4K6Y9_9EURO
MARTFASLPGELILEICDLLPLGDLTRFVRTCKFLAGLGASRIYRLLFSEKIDVGGIKALRSQRGLDYAAVNADRILAGRDDEEQTILHYIAEADNPDLLAVFIKHGADLDVKNETGWTPLHYALKNGSDEIVRKLLDAGADVLAPAGTLPTIGLPSNDITTATVQRLIAAFQTAGGDISAPGPEGVWTALHYASRQGQHQVVQTLIDHGASVFAPNSLGYVPLIVAIRWGKVESTRVLLEAMVRDSQGYDINAPIPAIKNIGHYYARTGMRHLPGGTILHFAVCTGHEGIVQLLLEHGADPRAEDNPINARPQTPFDMAVSSKSLEIVKLILQMDDPPKFWKSNGAFETGMYAAVRWPTPELVQLLVDLYKQGRIQLDLDQAIAPTFSICRDYNDQPSAQRANDCIKTLADAGMNLNDQYKHGVTLLHHLCAPSPESHLQKKLDLMDYLLDAGADWTLCAYRGDTVLHRLARIAHLGFDGIMRKILRMESGREAIHTVNNDGNTVLHLYLHSSDLSNLDRAEMVRMLVKAGCDLNVLNYNGHAVAHNVLFPMVSPKEVDLFEELGIDLSLLDSEGKPLLHYALVAQNVTDNEKEAVARHLVGKGAAHHAGCDKCEAFIGRPYNENPPKSS